jgi:hypothetical protein
MHEYYVCSMMNLRVIICEHFSQINPEQDLMFWVTGTFKKDGKVACGL